ncbi:hypothetical protein [Streptomyces sp. SID1121]|uniref:hypothetical protein n=1 Tax=Streptomyces sp. SID1121 TaxID=3425888 RepID=UPI00405607AC
MGITAAVDRGDLLAWWQGALAGLHAAVEVQSVEAAGPSGGLYASEIFLDEHGQATVFVPVRGPVRSVGGVESLVVPPAELAVVTHHGPLADIDVELGAYVTLHEISVNGPLREYYLRVTRHSTDASHWTTEVGWPIFRADQQPGSHHGPIARP